MSRNDTVSTTDAKTYVPRFAWRTDETGVQGIYDRDHRIARLEERVSPDGFHFGDVMLHEVFLRPPGVGPIQAEDQGYLFPRWRFHVYFVHHIEAIRVDEQGQRFRLYMRTCDQEVRDPDKDLYVHTLDKHGITPDQGRHPVFHDEFWLCITYDPERQTYVHDVHSRLTINPGKRLCIPFVLDHLEYQDLFPSGSFYPYMTGYDRRKYQWQVWEAPDGQVYKIPIHHLKSPDKEHIRIKEDGLFAYLLERTGNQAIHLVGDTATRSELAICWWMWDPHVYLTTGDKTVCESGETYDVHYRLFELDDARGRALLDRALLRPECSLEGVAAPMFTFGLNTFDEPVSTEAPSERWFWECNEKARWNVPRDQRHCLWDHTVSHSGTSSLALRGDADDQTCSWRVPFCGNHMRPPAELGKQQRLTAYVRTEAVVGKVRMGFRMISDPDAPMQYAEPELSGDHNWSQLELVTSPSSGGGNAEIVLELVGRGKAWFDDVEIANLD